MPPEFRGRFLTSPTPITQQQKLRKHLIAYLHKELNYHKHENIKSREYNKSQNIKLIFN